MEEEKIEEKKPHFFINLFLFLIILILGVYLYARYYEPSRFIVKEYRIASEEIPTNFSGIKIIHITDIYFGNTTDLKNVEVMVEKINELKPDIILFTGNLFGNNVKKVEELKSILMKLDSNLGKYAVKGNNDYIDEYSSFMEEINFKVLNNEYDLIYNEGLTPIYLCGLTSSLKEGVNIENCVNGYKTLEEDSYKPNYKIFMVHEGDVAKEIMTSDVKANLILAGNSLNGTINLPYYGQLIIPKGSKEFFGSHYKREDTEIYVSSGLGTDQYPYRLFNPPSINFYRLKSLQ